MTRLCATQNIVRLPAFINIVLSLLALTLSGCSTLKPQAPATDTQYYDWSQLRTQLLEQTSWQLMGKVGIRTSDESMTAAINNWTQVDDYFVVELSSTFLGLGSSRLFGNSSYLTLAEAGEEPITSNQPNELIESTLGLPLPIAFLCHWIKALPTPDAEFEIELNPQGLPKTITQHQWHIQFSNYAPQRGIPLPGKIKLERNDTRITLAIKKWTLPSP